MNNAFSEGYVHFVPLKLLARCYIVNPVNSRLKNRCGQNNGPLGSLGILKKLLFITNEMYFDTNYQVS